MLAYLPLWNAGFINMDDPFYLTENPVVQQGLTWDGIVWAFEKAHVANYHPVTWLSHMLDCSLFGMNPRWHHASSLLLHAINVVLVYLMLKWMTGRQWAAAFVAALFAIHPQHVESVAWLSERKDVLSGLFWLLTIAAYAWYVGAGGWWRYGLAMLGLALGLLSKPMVVTLPCVLLLLDVWPLGRTRWFAPATRDEPDAQGAAAGDGDAAGDAAAPISRQRSVPFLLLEKVPLFLLAVACSAITFLAQRTGGAVMTTDQMGLDHRAVNAVVAYARYARKFLWPSDLAAFYPLHPWPVMTFLGCLAALAALTALFLWQSRRRPYLGVGWLYFLGTLVPVIGLVQVGSQSMADRYMYLPMIGLGVMIAWLAVEWRPRVGARATAVAASVALAACGAVTFRDAGAWRDSERLFTRAMEITGPTVFSLRCVAASLVERGEAAQAVEKLRLAVSLQPANAHSRRLLAYALRGDKQYDQAIRELEVALSLKPDEAKTWNTLGHVFADQKNWDAAVPQYERAVELDPNDFDSWNNLAVAHHQAGRPDAALHDLRQAVRIAPKSAQAWYMLGRLLLERDRPAEAIEPLATAIRLDSRRPDAHLRLGLALMRSGRGELATAPLITAVQMAPASPEPLVPLAWLLATHPDRKLRSGKDALYLATRATELTKSASPEALDALAAALAEQERFKEAADAAEKARQLAVTSGNAKLAEEIATRVARYRDSAPSRDPSLVGADTGDAVP